MKKDIIQVRDLKIGEGRTKICIPLMPECFQDLPQALEALSEIPYDLVEWRADYYKDAEDEKSCREAIRMIRSAIGNKPLLFTYRTRAEGGLGSDDPAVYRSMVFRAVQSGEADLIDLEYGFLKGKEQHDTIDLLHRENAAVIGSGHMFDRTPHVEEMVRILCDLQNAGADITKLAVMPKTRTDVLRLMEAAVLMEETFGDRPCITISMGGYGVLSRIGGYLTGNALTFAAGTASSAPGQLSAVETDGIVRILEPDMTE